MYLHVECGLSMGRRVLIYLPDNGSNADYVVL